MVVCGQCGYKIVTSTNLHQHNCKPLISRCFFTPVFMLVILTACMLTGAMVPTVWMESAWLVGLALTALLSFIIQRSLPAFILAAGTVVLTLIFRLLDLTRTAAYLIDVSETDRPDRRLEKFPKSQHRPSLLHHQGLLYPCQACPLNDETSVRSSGATTEL